MPTGEAGGRAAVVTAASVSDALRAALETAVRTLAPEPALLRLDDLGTTRPFASVVGVLAYGAGSRARAEITGLRAALGEAVWVLAVAAPDDHASALDDGASDVVAATASEAAIAQRLRVGLAGARSLERLAALEDSDDRWRALSEATFEGVVVHERGLVVLANAAAERMFGVGPGGLEGRALLDFVAPESHDLVRAKVTAGDPGPYEGLGLRSDGTVFPTEVQARTVVRHGQPCRMIAVRDLTLRKQVEATLAASDRLASLGQLAAGVAHEINNPLAYVMLNLEALERHLRSGAPREPALEAPIAEAVREARAGAGRVQQIVRDLRSFSRAPEDEAIGPVDLERAVRFAASIAGGEVRSRARLEIDVAGAPRPLGDDTRIGQVLLNLLLNAAQAIPAGAPESHVIRVTARGHAEGRVVIEVSDDGAGVSESVRQRLFEPFVTTKPAGAGTGLGLYVCRGIVERLGGSIDVESELGRGAKFRVILPAETDATASAKTSASGARAATATTSKPRVLVIDDEALLRRAFVRALSRDHDVQALATATEASVLLDRGERFDVILCDLALPDMNGMELHAMASARWPDQADRMVFVSGGATLPGTTEFLARVPNARLQKPCSLDVLTRAVKTELSTRSRSLR